MKTVDLSELQKQILLTHPEALVITHNGKFIGHFYPKPLNQADINHLWERLDKATQRVMEETGLNEEGLVEALAPKKSKPLRDCSLDLLHKFFSRHSN